MERVEITGVPYFSRSTKVMFSAISATRFAMRDAMIVYGEACCWTPFATPLVACCVFFAAAPAGFVAREAVALLGVRLTGAEATEAGIAADFGLVVPLSATFGQDLGRFMTERSERETLRGRLRISRSDGNNSQPRSSRLVHGTRVLITATKLRIWIRVI